MNYSTFEVRPQRRSDDNNPKDNNKIADNSKFCEEWTDFIKKLLDTGKEDRPEAKYIYLIHEHFNCSEHEHFPESPLFPQRKYSMGSNRTAKSDKSLIDHRVLWEADTYRYEFNCPMFLKSLMISIVDIAGLKILLYLYKLISGSKFLNNFYCFGVINYFINIFGWINMLLVIHSIYQKTWIYADAECLGYMLGLLFLSIIGASQMSFINKKIPPLLETVELSGESCVKAGSWRLLRIQDELKRTILRLNFNASSFFMSFIENNRTARTYPRFLMENPEQQEDDLLANPKPQFQPPREQQGYHFSLKPVFSSPIQHEEDLLVLTEQISQIDLLLTAVIFECAVFYEKYLTQPSRYDEEKAYAYRYARDISAKYEKGSKYPYAFFLTVVGIIGTIVVSFMKFDASDLKESSENLAIGYLGKGALLLLNAIVTGATLFLISEGINIIWNRLCFVKGLTELISEEKPPAESLFRKDCSMINIFDFESLRTWASLRIIFMNINQKRLEAISLGISIIVVIQLTTISVLGFFYFTAEDSAEKAFFLQFIIFLGTPTFIYMIFILLFISIGAKVNNQYQEHIYRLKTLKITIYKLFALYPTFTGLGKIQPSTYLYARGLRYLPTLFGHQEDQEIPSALLDEKLEKINDAYDTIITELEVEEQNNPLTLLGIPMTDSFAGTVFGTILTVVMIPIGKYLAEITGWD